MTEPLAPDTNIGHSLGSYTTIDRPEDDPKGIGVSKALALIDRVIVLDGVTPEVEARNYTLTVTIAESHVSRRDEIVKNVIEIIAEFDNATA